jgi:dCMP deaminase
MIIGLTGTLAAGKGEVVEFLKQKGFKHYSVREFLTNEIKERGLEVNRDNMVLVANQLREMHSPSYIAEKLYEKSKKENSNCIIESLRTVGEINALKQKGEFFLISVDANQGIRYIRSQSRKSETDKISFEKFIDDEKKEMFSSDPNKQNLSECIKLADFKIENNGTLEELHLKLEEIFSKISETKKYVRPTWDEYFMEIAKTIAKRATCDRGRSGCVIAKDKQILVTGYVGSPKGLPHCDDIGHQFKKTIHEDGHTTNHCVRTIHAEQNAICQAAKLGVPVNGATLYCKMTPCRVCAMLIINSGIKRVICEKKYHAGAESEDMFKQAGIEIKFFEDKIEKYENQ